jgi:DNA-binding beta-propeller fold protein YncE
MNFKHLLLLAALFSSISCQKFFDKDYFKNHHPSGKEDPSSFVEVGSIDIGGEGAAEISAYDPKTERLFVVNNSGANKIDVIDLDNPALPTVTASIDLAPYAGAVNSVAVYDGLLAAAIESKNKQEPGKVVVFKTTNYAEVKVIPVGALPDMITFSPDGKYIVTANEGEPNTDYTADPVGSVSIISVKQNYAVVNVDFSAFASSQDALQQKGFRIFGPGASFAQDIEPEYVTISDDSKTAWVTLQENNGIAKIDLLSKKVTNIFPLGFKDYNLDANAIDVSDKDNAIAFAKWPVKGIYMPDAIAVLNDKGTPYLFTANEGDAREYNAFVEAKRISALTLDPVAFPNAAALQQQTMLGRLNVTGTLGDIDHDNDYDVLYSFGARSFSVWNGYTGNLVYDSKNDLEKRTVTANLYDDGRSDDKGVEPEGLTLGEVGNRKILFVGMERADAVAIYDVSNPAHPVFLQVLQTGDAPEGVLFIPAKESPVKHSLLIVSSEGDGVIKFYAPSKY